VTVDSSKFNTAFGFCLSLSLEQFDGLRYIGVEHDRVRERWVAKFCSTRPGGCTLGASDLDYLVEVMKRQIRRYRTACDKGCVASMAATLNMIFEAIFDQIERCVASLYIRTLGTISESVSDGIQVRTTDDIFTRP
jgi:hypothetical protein